MSTYYESDKQEWDDLILENTESKRHHYDRAPDLYDPDFWFWDDGREVDSSELERSTDWGSEPSSRWDWNW